MRHIYLLQLIKEEIKDFYPEYLKAHQNIYNRRLHLLGNCVTLLYIFFMICLWWPGLVLTPFIIYPFAWFGHLYFEKNKPATWSTPWYITKACDWIMMKDMMLGRLK
jgi:hypothetical protein